MYFRKLFTGTKGSESSKSMVRKLGSKDNYGFYYNYTIILNNAILDTLTAVGIDASFNNSTMVLTIGGFHIQVLSAGSFAAGFWEVFDCSGEYAVITSRGAIGDYTTYNFAVTLIGEPDGMLNICIGTKASPTDITEGICLAKISNLHTKEKLSGLGSAYTYGFRIFDELCTRKIITEDFSRYFQGSASDLMIPMQENISKTGFYKIDNAYTTNSAVVLYKNFYNIDGTLYFAPYNGCLTKCITG